MKLTQILEEESEILKEGLRFGGREKSLVKKEAKDIRVGIEYEYHLTDTFEDEERDYDNEDYQNAVWDRAHEIMQNDINEKKEEFLDGYADSDMDNFNIAGATANLNSIKTIYSNNYTEFNNLVEKSGSVETALGDWDEDEINNGFLGFPIKDQAEIVFEFFKEYKELNEHITNIHNEADAIEVEDQLDRIHWYLPGNGKDIEEGWKDFKTNANTIEDFYIDNDDDFNKVINVLENNKSGNIDLFPKELADIFKDSVENLKDEFESNDIDVILSDYDGILELIKELDGDDSDWDSAVREGFKESAEDLWDDSKESFLGYDPDDGPSDEQREEAEEEIDIDDFRDESSQQGSAVEHIENLLQDSSNPWNIDWNDIREVTTDGSVPDGVETITKPIPFMDSLELMENMFDHIQEVGHTSSSTGMHVNMSIKGLHFKRDNFNPTKLAMLMDERYLRQETKFPIRSYTASMFSEFTNSNLLVMAMEHAQRKKTDYLIELFEETVVPRTIKHRFINFNNITNNTDTSSQRIEFRFFGGKDYEKRYNEIEQDMYRTAYMMMVAYSEEFGQKEYFKKILQFLDKESENSYNMSFVDIVNFIRKNKKDINVNNTNELDDALTDKRSGDLTKFKKILRAKGLSGAELQRELAKLTKEPASKRESILDDILRDFS